MTGADVAGVGVRVGLVWAESRNRVIGNDGAMPWHLPEDMAHFKELTGDGAVLMGRRTWDSLPSRFRPLAGRLNIVITRQSGFTAEGASVVHSVEEALALAGGGPTWVIGGSEIYTQTFEVADVLEVTEINAEFTGNTRAPEIPDGWRAASVQPESGWFTSRTGLEYRWVRYLPVG